MKVHKWKSDDNYDHELSWCGKLLYTIMSRNWKDVTCKKCLKSADTETKLDLAVSEIYKSRPTYKLVCSKCGNNKLVKLKNKDEATNK